MSVTTVLRCVTCPADLMVPCEHNCNEHVKRLTALPPWPVASYACRRRKTRVTTGSAASRQRPNIDLCRDHNLAPQPWPCSVLILASCVCIMLLRSPDLSVSLVCFFTAHLLCSSFPSLSCLLLSSRSRFLFSVYSCLTA